MAASEVSARRMDRIPGARQTGRRSPQGTSYLTDRLSELEVHLADGFVVDAVSDVFAAAREFWWRIGSEQLTRGECHERVGDGVGEQVDAAGDLGPGGGSVFAKVSDDAGAHHVAESFDGVLPGLAAGRSHDSWHDAILPSLRAVGEQIRQT